MKSGFWNLEYVKIKSVGKSKYFGLKVILD